MEEVYFNVLTPSLPLSDHRQISAGTESWPSHHPIAVDQPWPPSSEAEPVSKGSFQELPQGLLMKGALASPKADVETLRMLASAHGMLRLVRTC